MKENDYLRGHLLIAMPNLQDPNFLKSVTYICEHNEEGAFGVVINRPIDAKLSEIMMQLDIDPPTNEQFVDQPLFVGGPVDNERGLILHSPIGDWASTLAAQNDIGLTSSLDIMRSIGYQQAPDNFMVVLGYAGWSAGQLETEMSENVWLNGPANLDIIFNRPPAERWTAAAQLLGVDLNLLSSEVGHA